MRRPLVIYEFATDPFWISLYLREIWFSLLSVYKDEDSLHFKVHLAKKLATTREYKIVNMKQKIKD